MVPFKKQILNGFLMVGSILNGFLMVFYVFLMVFVPLVVTSLTAVVGSRSRGRRRKTSRLRSAMRATDLSPANVAEDDAARPGTPSTSETEDSNIS